MLLSKAIVDERNIRGADMWVAGGGWCDAGTYFHEKQMPLVWFARALSSCNGIVIFPVQLRVKGIGVDHAKQPYFVEQAAVRIWSW